MGLSRPSAKPRMATLTLRDVAASAAVSGLPEEQTSDLSKLLPPLSRRRGELRTLRDLAPGAMPPAPAMLVADGRAMVRGGAGRADDDPVFWSCFALAAAMRRREIGSGELTRRFLDRIGRFDPGLFAIAEIAADTAMQAATAADARIAAGAAIGPLDGIPFLAKDIIDSAAIPTRRGSRFFADRVPTDDAAVVAALRRAGAVLLGKAACGELAYGDTWSGGRTRNPWHPAEGASGSSGGSAAAVAAGLCAFALGTETLGSTLMPAERCGVIGVRAGHGRASMAGVMPVCPSLDTIGVMTRRPADAALVLAAILAPPTSADAHPFAFDDEMPPSELVVGYVPAAFNAPEIDPLERRALALAERAGFRLRRLEWPALPFDLLRAAMEIEAADTFDSLLPDDFESTLVWQAADGWPTLLRAARRYPAVDHLKLARFRREAIDRVRATVEPVDALLTPHHAGGVLIAGNFAGLPAVSLPCGTTRRPVRDLFDRRIGSDGAAAPVPKGVCLLGRLGGEDRLLMVAEKLQRAGGPLGPPPGYA